MKNKEIAAYLAEQWSDAYSADRCGRGVSEAIIEQMLSEGYTEEDAEVIYRSKHTRWFFDECGDKVTPRNARKEFKKYLEAAREYISDMFRRELKREPSVA